MYQKTLIMRKMDGSTYPTAIYSVLRKVSENQRNQGKNAPLLINVDSSPNPSPKTEINSHLPKEFMCDE